MKITDAFLGEHAVFYAAFDAIEQTLETDDLAALQARVAAFSAALESHARLENELLFNGSEAAAFRVMESEHQEIERLLHALPRVKDPGEARALVRDIVELARDHFRKEETIAFSLLAAALGKEKLLLLGDRWAEARGVRI